MEVIMVEDECFVLWQCERRIIEYAVQMKREFSVGELAETYGKKWEKKLEKSSARIYLEGLVEKQILKKRYQRTGLFRWEPFYQALCDESFSCFIKHMDFRTKAEAKAWIIERDRLNKIFWPWVIF